MEEKTVGEGGNSRMRVVQASDSKPVAASKFKAYLLRVASLRVKSKDGFLLGWKQTPGGTADGFRPEEGTPCFAEMASPGTVFEGHWSELDFLSRPEIRHALHWKEMPARRNLFEAAKRYAQALLDAHARYGELASMNLLLEDLKRLKQKLEEVWSLGIGCLLPLGWGAGYWPG